MLEKFRKIFKRKKGASGPEMLLYLAIAALIVLFVMKIRADIINTQNTNNLKQGIDFIGMNLQRIYAGSLYTDLTTSKAIEMGAVPRIMSVRGIKVYHPMNGEVEITKGSEDNLYKITVKGLKKSTCFELEKFQPDTWAKITASCGSSGSNNTVSFEGQ